MDGTALYEAVSAIFIAQLRGKWSFRRNSQTKIFTFIVVKSGNLCLKVSPEGPFYWKLLKIGIHSA